MLSQPSGPQFAIEYQAIGLRLVPDSAPQKMRPRQALALLACRDDNFEKGRLLR
jgi:hypothetical protein